MIKLPTASTIEIEEDLDHKVWMGRALALAKKGVGFTSPNPAVGAVVVKDGRIVGEGYHQRAGGPHAEVHALNMAGEAARGATIYVTLEPCSHHGKTPPCSHAIIRAGIRHVVYAIGDPNPKVNGRGAAQLREAGIRVSSGVLEREAHALNRPFFKMIQTGMPYVTAKFGMSLDGKIGTHTGESKWITNASARHQGHYLRQASDAILVGANTAIQDNPRLTTRLPDAPNQPLSHPTRIVLDSRGRVPLESHLFDQTLPGQTIVATTPAVKEQHLKRLVNKGIDVWVIDSSAEGQVDLTHLLKTIADAGMLSVMVEGGGTLLGSFLNAGLIDAVWAFIAPTIIGGGSAPTPFGGTGFAHLADALQLHIESVTQLDGNIWIQATTHK